MISERVLQNFIKYNFIDQIHLMGGQESKFSKFDNNLKINRKQWKFIESQKEYDIVRHINSGQYAQLYHIHISDQTNIQNAFETVNYRSKAHKNIVKVIGAELIEKGMPICGKSKHADILIERIPTTLEQSRQLQFKQSIIVLYNAVNGFHQLNQKYGYFSIKEGMIGFSQNQNIKVWISENLGALVSNQQISAYDSKAELRQLHSLFNLIQTKYGNGFFEDNFRNRLYQQRTFVDCLNFLKASNICSYNQLEANKIKLNLNTKQILSSFLPSKIQTIKPQLTSSYGQYPSLVPNKYPIYSNKLNNKQIFKNSSNISINDAQKSYYLNEQKKYQHLADQVDFKKTKYQLKVPEFQNIKSSYQLRIPQAGNSNVKFNYQSPGSKI